MHGHAHLRCSTDLLDAQRSSREGRSRHILGRACIEARISSQSARSSWAHPARVWCMMAWWHVTPFTATVSHDCAAAPAGAWP